MAQHEVDVEDASVLALFGLAAGAVVEIANVELYGHSMQDAIFSLVGADITIASAIAAGSFVFVVVTNQVNMEDIQDLDQEYYYAVIATAVLVFAIPFIPTLHDFVTSNDTYALIALVVQNVGIIAVAWYA